VFEAFDAERAAGDRPGVLQLGRGQGLEDQRAGLARPHRPLQQHEFGLGVDRGQRLRAGRRPVDDARAGGGAAIARRGC
jgi:hypothetical protein